jgi:hypothetical protein
MPTLGPSLAAERQLGAGLARASRLLEDCDHPPH